MSCTLVLQCTLGVFVCLGAKQSSFVLWLRRIWVKRTVVGSNGLRLDCIGQKVIDGVAGELQHGW
jgi:hypothetical protein